MIYYPSYISVFDQNKPRRYPSDEALLKTNPHVKGVPTKILKQMNRHHINLDRSDGRAENIHVVNSDTHTQLHQQLHQMQTEMINKGIIGYDRKNPHYFIKDKNLLEKLTPALKEPPNLYAREIDREKGKYLAALS